MQVYGYWRSSSSYRLRLALAYKGIEAEMIPMHLVRDGGEHNRAEYAALNPARRVPSLVLQGGIALTQSLAIMEWLEEVHPSPPLLPGDVLERAHVRAMAHEIAVDTQPLHNSSVLNVLKDEFAASPDQQKAWVQRWVGRACAIVEALAERTGAGAFLFGDTPTLADICLEPHLYTAERWGVDLSPFARLRAARAALLAWPGMAEAHPDRQPDALS
jgi:maleylacetoacetate isomerase